MKTEQSISRVSDTIKINKKHFPAEILHRLRHPGQAPGALHAQGDGQLQVQDLARGRLHAL